MDNQKYFYISGFISLSIFFLFLSMFVMMLFQVQDLKSYALKKNNYISISLDVVPQVKATKKSNSISYKIESTTVSKTKNIDVNNLFSDVWTQKIDKKVEKKEINSKRINDIQKQIKLKDSNNVAPIEKSTLKDSDTRENPQDVASSSADEVNEYLAKIQSIVYQHFNVPQNSQGNSVKTVIELDPFGKLLDFRVLTYSSNEALNKEADKIKERLKLVVFPVNPEYKATRTVVILISKE